MNTKIYIPKYEMTLTDHLPICGEANYTYFQSQYQLTYQAGTETSKPAQL